MEWSNDTIARNTYTFVFTNGMMGLTGVAVAVLMRLVNFPS